jgi:hypothetical protein
LDSQKEIDRHSGRIERVQFQYKSRRRGDRYRERRMGKLGSVVP